MTEDMVMSIAADAIKTTIYLAGPMLLAAMVIGILVSVLQAITQVNESTLTFIPKMVAVLLVMTVNPGFGGQQFIPHSLDKIARARELLDAAKSGAVLEVDGGINRKTIASARQAGADAFVAGNAVFTAADVAAEIAALRQLTMARA